MFYLSRDIMNRVRDIIKNSDKISLCFYVILRLLIIVCLIFQLILGNIENVLLCILSLILFMLPTFIKRKFKVVFPNVLEIAIILFIFCAEILGTINNFYNIFPNFDNLLHVVNGFLCASVGFSLIYLLNENVNSFNLSAFFVCLFAFCFSMTIGIFWEFFEYGMDKFFSMNTQKDSIVYELEELVSDVDYTLVYDKNGDILEIDGYLDLGLKDTIYDLFVNFIGAFVYCVFGYFYIKNKGNGFVVSKFLITRVK